MAHVHAQQTLNSETLIAFVLKVSHYIMTNASHALSKIAHHAQLMVFVLLAILLSLFPQELAFAPQLSSLMAKNVSATLHL